MIMFSEALKYHIMPRKTFCRGNMIIILLKAIRTCQMLFSYKWDIWSNIKIGRILRASSYCQHWSVIPPGANILSKPGEKHQRMYRYCAIPVRIELMLFSMTETNYVASRYSTIKCLQKAHNTHSIICPWGRDVEWILCVQIWICFLD